MRTVTAARILNNRNSVPPLSLRLATTGQTKRGVAVSGMFLVGDGGAGGYTYSTGALPAGLTLNAATGEITGTPTIIAHNIVSATVTDSATNTFTTSVTIDVHANLVATVFPTPCERNWAYSFQFNVSGATGAVTYAVTSGAIPAGLTLTAGGLLSGTPTTAAGTTVIFEVTATDAGSGDTLLIPCSMLINSEYKTINTPPHFQITVGVSVVLANGSIGGVPPYSYTPVGSLPAGLTITNSKTNNTATVLATQPFASTLFGTSNGYLATDALGNNNGTGGFFFLTAIDPSPKIQPQQNSVDIGPSGPAVFNFVNARVENPTGDDVKVTVGLFAVVTGTDTYAATPSPACNTYTNLQCDIQFTNANTGASTLNLNGLGAKALQLAGAALTTGQLVAGGTYRCVYDGTQFQVEGISSGGGSGTVTTFSVVTANGVSATVDNPTTTPAATFTLGAITPSSVAASGTVTGSNLSGTNTGDVTLAAVGSAPNANAASLAGQVLTLQPFAASGASHFPGIVPDPGASAGTTKFLREDATWAAPAGGTSNSPFTYFA